MDKKNFILLVGLVFMLVSINFVLALDINNFFEINLRYDGIKFNLENFTVTDSPKVDPEQQAGIFSAQLISFNRTILNEAFFNIYYVVLIDSIENNSVIGERKTINLTEITIYLPYNENAQYVEIKDPISNTLLSFYVDKYAKDLCGDGICQGYELAESCPSDCLMPAYEESGETEKTFAERVQEAVSENFSYTIVIILAVLILVIVILLKKRRKIVPQQQAAY